MTEISKGLRDGILGLVEDAFDGKIPAGVTPAQALRQALDLDMNADEETDFLKPFNYKPFDVAAAFERALKRLYGNTGAGKATKTMFGKNPPEYLAIPSGPRGETIQVPWGEVELSVLDATFEVSMTRDPEYGYVGLIRCTAPRKHKKEVDRIWATIEDELVHRSMYKGHAITAHKDRPEFLDTTLVDPAKVIYTDDVMHRLNVNLWTPIKNTDVMRKLGVPVRRAVLLEGPNGTGKSMAGALTSQVATANGWTYILVRASDDPFEALKTAKMYSPAIVWIEDLDVLAAAEGHDRKQISKVLDALDGVQGKGVEVMAGFTSNFAGELAKGVIRPGRLDAVIHIGALDAGKYEELIRALIPEELLAGTDLTPVVAAFDGFVPAFAAEATIRALRYAIDRVNGIPDSVTTRDLLAAAADMGDHLRLMEQAEHRAQPKDTLDEKLHGIVEAVIKDVLKDTIMGKMVPGSGGYDITFKDKEDE